MTCFPYWTLIKRRLTHAFTKEQDLKRNISLTRVLILSLLRHSSTQFKSCHPHKVKKSFMKGEGLRLLRRRLSKKTLKDSKYAFNQEAIPSNLTDETLSEIKFSDRKTALKENTRVRKNLLLFVTQYNPSVSNLF